MKAALTALAATSLLVLAVPDTLAQTLYKCVDEKGMASYQQARCDDASEDAGEIRYERQPDRPHYPPVAAKRPAQAPSGQSGQAAPVAPVRGSPPEINPMSDEAEAQRRLQHLAGTREGRSLLRQLQDEALADEEERRPTAETAPSQLRDQHGNTYTRPPGSAFARDDKTGKQCFVNGAFIKC